MATTSQNPVIEKVPTQTNKGGADKFDKNGSATFYVNVGERKVETFLLNSKRAMNDAGVTRAMILDDRSFFLWIKEKIEHLHGQRELNLFIHFKSERGPAYYQVPFTNLFGNPIPKKMWPNNRATVFVDDNLLKEIGHKEIKNIEKLKTTINSRLSRMNIFGYWDLISPFTPLVEKGISWAMDSKPDLAPQFQTSKTNDVRELARRADIIEACLENTPRGTPYREDMRVLTHYVRQRLGDFNVTGLERAMGFLNAVAGLWQKHQNLEFFPIVLKSYRWPIDVGPDVQARFAIYAKPSEKFNKHNSKSFSVKKMYKRKVLMDKIWRSAKKRTARTMSPAEFEKLFGEKPEETQTTGGDPSVLPSIEMEDLDEGPPEVLFDGEEMSDEDSVADPRDIHAAEAEIKEEIEEWEATQINTPPASAADKAYKAAADTMRSFGTFKIYGKETSAKHKDAAVKTASAFKKNALKWWSGFKNHFTEVYDRCITATKYNERTLEANWGENALTQFGTNVAGLILFPVTAYVAGRESVKLYDRSKKMKGTHTTWKYVFSRTPIAVGGFIWSCLDTVILRSSLTSVNLVYFATLPLRYCYTWITTPGKK